MKTSLLLVSSVLIIAYIQSLIINHTTSNSEPQVLKVSDKTQEKPPEKLDVGQRYAQQSLRDGTKKSGTDDSSENPIASDNIVADIVSEP